MKSLNLSSPEALAASQGLFREVTGRICLALMQTNALKATGINARGQAVAELLVGVCGTADAISKVGSHPAWVDEAYMLGRSFLERCVNISYLIVCGDDEFREMLDHDLSRQYSNTNRSVVTEHLSFTVAQLQRPELAELDERVRSAVEKFTDKRGRHKDWTALSLPQRIDRLATLEPNCGLDVFLLVYLAVYAHASEALHGSLAGVRHFNRGEFAFDHTRGDYTWDDRSSQLLTLFVALSKCAVAVLRLLNVRFPHPALQSEANSMSLALDSFFKSLKM